MSLRILPFLTLAFAIASCATAQQVLIDDFSAAPHASLPGESRAAFPPGTSGGSIVDLAFGTNISTDRGLFGAPASIEVAGATLNFSVPTGIVEFDWNVNGYDFSANGMETISWRELTNTSGQDISLRLELFQTFNGTDSVIGTGVVDIVLLDGETRDVLFNAIGGSTDFAGFRLVNQSAATFNGTLISVVAVPEPTFASVILIGLLGTTARRRRITYR